MRLRNLLTAGTFALLFPVLGISQTVDELIAKNIAARGGLDAWHAVSSLKLTGWMDVGQEMLVPYVLEQKRPDKMRLEFVFDKQTAIQAYDGKSGWKLRPFLGRTAPESITGRELQEVADTADLYGLLFDYKARGHIVEFLGREQIEGKDTFKLKVTLPEGTVRWVYLDPDSGLETKVEATRILRGKEHRVETFYREWKTEEGLLVPSRQETRTEGEKTMHLLTVQNITVNPPISDSRFEMPANQTLADTHNR